MAYYYERRDRPGVHPIIGTLRGTPVSGSTSGGGGGEPATGVLKCSDDGVLIYTGAAPKMDGTVLVYTPTPAMAGNVMTIR